MIRFSAEHTDEEKSYYKKKCRKHNEVWRESLKLFVSSEMQINGKRKNGKK